jgi:MFS family permease
MTGSIHTVNTAGTAKTFYAGLNGRKLGLLISTISTTGFLLFGYDQGVMSGIISADPFNNYFPQTKNDSVYQGFVTAIYEIGCLIGAIFVLAYGDKLGRRRAVSHPPDTLSGPSLILCR